MTWPMDFDPAIFFDKHPEPMWIYDRQTLRFLTVNEVAISRYGYNRDEFLAMTIADIRPREEHALLSSNLASASGDAHERSGLWQHRRKSGEALYVEIISSAISFAGRPARLVIARDATARASLEANLHQAQSRLRLANWELDLTEDTARWPPQVYELLGVTPDDFSNTREAFLDLVHPEDRARYIAAQKRAISERSLFDEEYRIQHPSGEVRFLHEVGEVVAVNERPVFSAVVQDITEVVLSRAESQRMGTRLQEILEGMSEGFFMLDAEWRYYFVNGHGADMLRIPRQDLEGATVWEVFPSLVGTGFETAFRKARASGKSQRVVEYFAPHERWYHVTVHPGAEDLAVYFRDVTEETHAMEHRRLLDTAIQKLGEVVIITKASPVMAPDEPRIIYVNDAITAQTGYRPEDVLGQTPRMFQGPETEGRELAKLRAAIAEKRSERVELVNYTRTGDPYWVEINLSAVENSDGTCSHFIAIQRDITKRKQTEDVLRIAATRDELTGLINRSGLTEILSLRLEEMKTWGGSHALLFLDLDDFKTVNDTLGHGLGDQLLAAVAQRLSGLIRDSDTLARMSGDEFVVLVPGSTLEDAIDLARRLLDALVLPFDLHGGRIALSASIGIVIAPEDGENSETLIRNADVAMYCSKANGRNTFTRFEPRQHQTVVRRTNMAQALQASLHEDEDFWLLYQPQVTCDAARSIVGAEALLRWNGPESGSAGPGEFIPVAESTGLIRQIDRKVIDLAAGQVATWVRAGIALPVSVNISAISLQTEGFATGLLRRLEAHGVPHALFQVEIVESAYLRGSTSTLENLERISQAGICISIDDFGTGHSSLSYLRRLPVRFLKMDRSFVKRVGVRSSRDDALARAILAMAQALKVDVIAEGVETEDQFSWLEQNGCPQVQGFLTGRPLEPEIVIERYLERSANQGRRP